MTRKVKIDVKVERKFDVWQTKSNAPERKQVLKPRCCQSSSIVSARLAVCLQFLSLVLLLLHTHHYVFVLCHGELQTKSVVSFQIRSDLTKF